MTTTQQRALVWALIATTGIAVLWGLSAVLTPFLVASVLAYALAPLVSLLVRCRFPRWLAVLVVETLFLLAALSLLLLIVPVLVRELPLLREQVPILADSLQKTLQPLAAQYGFKLSFDVGSLKAFLLKYFNSNWEDVFSQAMSSLRLGGSVAFAVVGNVVLIPVALYYLLADWDRFVAMLKSLVPPRMRAAVDSFTGEADDVLGQYLRGQLLVMVALAVFYAVGLALFGLDLAVPIGVFTGLAVFVPYLGFGVGLVLALMAGLLQFGVSSALIMVAVVYGAGQVIEGFVLTPRFVGERIGLHPLAVIFALLAFGQMLGFVGVLIALPASAVLLVAIRRVRSGYLASQLYREV
ncbi:MAG: AI-2E family transporter [Betaproteobacteria bacterium]|nr:AI-2E family transporter [Betaproteobacteria bacterium]